MKLLRTKLVTAIAIAIASGSAMAGWVTAPTIGGQEVIVQDKNAGALSASVNARYTMAAPEALSDGDIIALKVINGAWATAVGPAAAATGGAVLVQLGSADAATLALLGATADASVVYYRVDASGGTIDPADIVTFPLMGGETNLNGTDLNDNVYYAVSFYTALGAIKHSVIDITTGLVATGIDLLTCGLTNSSTTDIIDVGSTGGYSQFISVASGGSGAAVTNPLHSPDWSITTHNISGTNTSNADIPVGSLVLSALVATTNPTSLIGSTIIGADLASFGAGSLGVFVAPGVLPQQVANNVGLNTLTTWDIEPEIELLGTNSPAHTVTYSAEVIDSPSWEPQLLTGCDPVVFTGTHNGSEFSTNSTGISNKIRITDMSGDLSPAGALVRVVGYARDGSILPNTLVPDVVPNNGTMVIKGEDLMSSFAPGSPDRIDFTVESNHIEAANIKTTGSGGTVTKNTTIYRSNQAGGNVI